jgi:predicted ATPase
LTVTSRRPAEKYSVEDKLGKSYFANTRLIERVEIENFKLFDRLELDFTRSESVQAPWTMLLGENATGKSAVLQAIALALAGTKQRRQLGVRARDVVRRGQSSGRVRVHLSGEDGNVIDLKVSRAQNRFYSTPSEPRVLLLGYGSTRLLPGSGAPPAEHGASPVSLMNLFDSRAAVGDHKGWLLALDKPRFDEAAEAILEVFGWIKRDTRMRRVGGKSAGVVIDRGRRSERIEVMSDGYQSVVALMTDVVRMLFGTATQKRWRSLDAAEGIVLIDEIGVHLHPRWRMGIVSALREVFPRVQFIVTTHDPLCLRGLRNGEVITMHRSNRNRIFARTDLPPVEGMRVDQLLTSEHFGLESTLDPAVQSLMGRYQQLLAKPRPTPGEKKKLGELRKQLREVRVLGSDERERRLLEVIDKSIVQERRADDEKQRARLKEATKKEVLRLWKETMPEARR